MTSKLAGAGAVTLLALAAPVLAVLALLGMASDTLACTTLTTSSVALAPAAPIPPAARLWIAVARESCPRLPEPWIAALMYADSRFDPTHTSAAGRGVITVSDADWTTTYGGPVTGDRDHDGTPDIADPLLESGVAGTVLCRGLDAVTAWRTTHPQAANTTSLTDLDLLAVIHAGGTAVLATLPVLPTTVVGYLTQARAHAVAWSAPTNPTATPIASPVPSATVDPACVSSISASGSIVIPPGTPRSVADAITASLALVGTRSGFTNRCDHLACLAYGYGNSGYDTAADHWRTMLATGHAHPGDHCPPAGAFVFWATRGPEGHVSLIVASDPGCDPATIKLVSNDVLDGQTGWPGGVYLVSLAQIESGFVTRAGYLGWTDPVCAGTKLRGA